MPSHDAQTAALVGATAKLTSEDRTIVLSTFVRILMASCLAVSVGKKNPCPLAPVESLAQFADPHLVTGTAMLLAGVLGSTPDESLVIRQAMHTTAREFQRLLAEDPESFTDMLSDIIVTAGRSFLP